MIYIETGSEDVAFNFALEYYFAAEKQLSDTVFLLWQTTPTLMVGKYQNVLEEINKPYADKHNIHVARRMSGGGTIYTDEGGLQFTFICREAEKEISFQQYITPIIEAVRALGIDASFNGRNDLTILGKKFSGNAQYRLNGSVVHHGSLLFNTDIEQIVVATSPDPDKIQSKGIQSVRDRVTNISEYLSQKLSVCQFKAHLLHFITQGAETYTLTPADLQRIGQIADEKFRSWESIYGRNPKFSIQRIRRFPGGKIEALVNVSHGMITELHLHGDFFAAQDIDALCASLCGCRYDQASVHAALCAANADEAIYKISAAQLACAIVD